MYKKRYARSYQKKLAAERAGKNVHKGTLNAIENNRQWIAHYEQKIKEHET